MNRAFSVVFGFVLAFFHLVFIVVLSFVLTNSKWDMAVPTALLMGVGYVLVVGVACTLLAIREHLETLIAQRSPPAEL